MKSPSIWEAPHPIRLLVHLRMRPNVDRFPTRRHCHDFFELGIVLSGECLWRVRHRELKLRRGQAILIKPRSMHSESAPPHQSSELAWIGIDYRGPVPSWAEKVVTLGNDFEEIAASFDLIERERNNSDALTCRRVDLLLQSIFLLVTRRAEAVENPSRKVLQLNFDQMSRVEAAADYFRRHLGDSVSIAAVSAAHSLSPAYFSTLFRMHYKVPPRVFLRQAKLEKARELMLTTELPLKEISTKCGFTDASHLNKSFKRAHRLTPRQFRQTFNHRQGSTPQPSSLVD